MKIYTSTKLGGHQFIENYTVLYLAVGLLYKINFRREEGDGVRLIILLPSKTQYYPSKTWVFPVKPTGLGNTHKSQVFANLALATKAIIF